MSALTQTTNPAYDFMKTVCDAIQTIEQEYASYLFAKYIKPTVAPEAIEEHKTKYMNTLFIKRSPCQQIHIFKWNSTKLPGQMQTMLLTRKHFRQRKRTMAIQMNLDATLLNRIGHTLNGVKAKQ